MSNPRRKKILFVIPSLGGGGAERLLIDILKYLDRRKFNPYIVLFKQEGVYLDQVPEDAIINLDKKNRFDFLKLVFRLAWTIYPKVKPALIVSFLEYANLVSLLAIKLSPVKPPLIISEHNHLTMHQKYTRMKLIKKLLVKKLYPQADKIIAVSRGVQEDLNTTYGIPNKKIRVIYNGVNLSFIELLSQENTDGTLGSKNNIPTIVACGRLTRQKNYPLVIKAFAKLQVESKARLVILGAGEERKSLEKLGYKLGVKDKVVFLGFQKNPYKFIARSTVFVLSSSWEGFGIVIVEAMACGVPVISADCPSGPREIITNWVNGILVPAGDVDALAKAISRLLKDEPLRKRLAEAGRRRAEDFRVEKMVAEYKRIFEEVAFCK